MQNYVVAMFVQTKYFIIKITFLNITDTEHRKLRRNMVQTSVKKFFSKHLHEDKFQTTYINQINSSLVKTFWRKICHIDGCIQSLSTRLLKLRKEDVPGLNDSKLHGINYVSIKEKTGKHAEELLNLRTLYNMMERISKAIWFKLKNVKNEFNDLLWKNHLCLVSCLFYSN